MHPEQMFLLACTPEISPIAHHAMRICGTQQFLLPGCRDDQRTDRSENAHRHRPPSRDIPQSTLYELETVKDWFARTGHWHGPKAWKTFNRRQCTVQRVWKQMGSSDPGDSMFLRGRKTCIWQLYRSSHVRSHLVIRQSLANGFMCIPQSTFTLGHRLSKQFIQNRSLVFRVIAWKGFVLFILS